ncbi:phage tail protein [Bacillus cereus]|uniref:phage tail protein n=1 Tax=Bacillus cereus TaxID=1396 RepID=UPI000BFC68FF|nr:phage tail protein [Bacillus cereus]PGT05102.1 phage tail protein [Bacillus cereus]
MPTIDVFDAVEIKNASVLFKGATVSEPFGCVGKLDAETEIKSISKLCGGVIQKKKSKPSQLTVTISGHMQLKVLRDIFGITNDGLVTDVYAYGIDSIGKDFSFVAEEADIFEGNKRLIAFPNCTAATGYVKSVENGAEELAEFELEITALPDAYGQLYYEGINLTGTVESNWLTKFDPASLQKTTV